MASMFSPDLIRSYVQLMDGKLQNLQSGEHTPFGSASRQQMIEPRFMGGTHDLSKYYENVFGDWGSYSLQNLRSEQYTGPLADPVDHDYWQNLLRGYSPTVTSDEMGDSDLQKHFESIFGNLGSGSGLQNLQKS